MSSLSYHSVPLLLIAHDAARKARADAARPDALTTDSLVAIIMAATAAEAFINELADYLQDFASINESLGACADAVKKVEEDHGPVTLKYLEASRALCGRMFNKGTQPYQDFAQLISLRNAIVHLKPGDTRGPKGADMLTQKGLAHDHAMPWPLQLEKPQTAEWAVGAAHRIMLAILELTPEHGERDPLNLWKLPLREL